jgi:hypothetical protein
MQAMDLRFFVNVQEMIINSRFKNGDKQFKRDTILDCY